MTGPEFAGMHVRDDAYVVKYAWPLDERRLFRALGGERLYDELCRRKEIALAVDAMINEGGPA